MAAIGALEPGEAYGKVTATVELTHDGDGIAVEWPVDGAVALLVAGFEIGPAAVDKLPKRRSTGTAWAVDGGHNNCSLEQLLCRLPKQKGKSDLVLPTN